MALRRRTLALALMIGVGLRRRSATRSSGRSRAALWLGHEAAAVLAVVAAFFGGLASARWRSAGAIERSARPARWYAACEAVIGVWALALALLLAPVTELAARR